MLFKKTIHWMIIIAFVLLLLASPQSALAWGGCASSYNVRWGDTLWSIANNYGTTAAAMRQANPNMGYVIHAGQTLCLPDGGNGYSSYPAPGYGGSMYQGMGRGYNSYPAPSYGGSMYQGLGSGYNSYRAPSYGGSMYQGMGRGYSSYRAPSYGGSMYQGMGSGYSSYHAPSYGGRMCVVRSRGCY